MKLGDVFYTYELNYMCIKKKPNMLHTVQTCKSTYLAPDCGSSWVYAAQCQCLNEYSFPQAIQLYLLGISIMPFH